MVRVARLIATGVCYTLIGRMSRTTTIIGPGDQGRAMSLDEFDLAEAQDGYLYELGRGVVVVTDVPSPSHFARVEAIRRQLYAYDAAHSGTLYGIAAGSDAKILVEAEQSERHPDLLIYKTPPPETDVWSTWVPEIVIEVVSPSSARRDYEEKPAEYLAFGVSEYWLVDAEQNQMTVLRRTRGRWAPTIVRHGETYRTHLLPDFELNLTAVLDAARGK